MDSEYVLQALSEKVRRLLVFGEGPTEVPEGAFTDVGRESFTSEDIRFTYRVPYVYANVLSWPESGDVTVKYLGVVSEQKGKGASARFMGHVEEVEVLGYDNPVTFTRDAEGLHIKVEGSIDTDYPVCLKVTID